MILFDDPISKFFLLFQIHWLQLNIFLFLFLMLVKT